MNRTPDPRMPAALERDTLVAGLRPALVLFVALTLITGLAYPWLVTIVAQAVYPDEASGSLLRRGDTVVGSRLIGQSFSDPKFLWGRPSATSPMPHNAAASGGSNLGPTNPALADAMKARADALRAADPMKRTSVPVELVTASASGLDPHLSPGAADWQVPRIAAARGLADAEVRQAIALHTRRPMPSFLGEPVVDVLQVNLELDRRQSPSSR